MAILALRAHSPVSPVIQRRDVVAMGASAGPSTSPVHYASSSMVTWHPCVLAGASVAARGSSGVPVVVW